MSISVTPSQAAAAAGAVPTPPPISLQPSSDDDAGELSVTLQSVQVRMEPVMLYTRRYLMLFLFSALGFIQCAIWNTWGPLASTIKIAYPAITNSSLATFALWGPVTCIGGTFFCMLLIQREGLRKAMVSSTLLMAIGCSIRCITMDSYYFPVTAHVGAMLNGFAGVAVGVAPALLSTLWFPVSFRTTATGIGCTMNQLGNAGGFFLGPYLVQLPPDILKAIDYDEQTEEQFESAMHYYLNGEYSCGKKYHCCSSEKIRNIPPQDIMCSLYPYGGDVYRVSPWSIMRHNKNNKSHEFSYTTLDNVIVSNRSSIVTPELQYYLKLCVFNYMVITAGLSIALFVLVLFFFEDEPPTPPIPLVPATDRRWVASISSSRRSRVISTAAAQQQRPLLEVAKLVVQPFKNASFVAMLICYSLTLGINVAWCSVLAVNLEPFGVSQKDSSWIGVYITFGGVMMAIMSSRVSDYFQGKYKIIILILLSISTIGYIILLMTLKRCFPYSYTVLVLSAVVGGSFNYAVSPLFFEFFMEIGYPTPEDVLGSILTIAWNMAGLLFLFVMEISSDDEKTKASSVLWMDYLLIAQGIVCIIVIWFVREEYKRSGAIFQDKLSQSNRAGLAPIILEEEHLSCSFISDSDTDNISQCSSDVIDEVATNTRYTRAHCHAPPAAPPPSAHHTMEEDPNVGDEVKLLVEVPESSSSSDTN